MARWWSIYKLLRRTMWEGIRKHCRDRDGFGPQWTAWWLANILYIPVLWLEYELIVVKVMFRGVDHQAGALQHWRSMAGLPPIEVDRKC